jgi:hypothetical protein
MVCRHQGSEGYRPNNLQAAWSQSLSVTSAFFVPSKEAGDMVSAVVLRLAEEAEVSASSGAGPRAGAGAGPEADRDGRGEGVGEGRGDEGYYDGGDEYLEEMDEPALQVGALDRFNQLLGSWCRCLCMRVCVKLCTHRPCPPVCTCSLPW